MSASYLHGVETIQVEIGSRSIQVVKSAVIGLIGISPIGPKNEVVLVSNDRDAAQFGLQIPGFTIPQSLDAIFAQGAGTVLVVNVFDPAFHTTAVTAESHTVTDGGLRLSSAPIGTVVVKDSAGAAVAYVLGTDYSIDEYGNFKVLSNLIANGTVLKFDFKKLNVSAINGTVIAGSLDSGTGVRTGMFCYDLAFNTFGFNPKILIAPGFSGLSSVANTLISATTKYRAITYISAPIGTTVAGAIAGRGPLGSINFNTSDKRVELLYPHIKKYDPDASSVAGTDVYINFDYSAFLAGIRASVDINEGFWVSSSNHEIKGTTGAERMISAGISDPNSDANLLNAAGITTVFNTFGTGNRTWGNRNASFPVNTAADSFMNIVRINDIVDESLEQAALPFVDKPITQALIDTIREAGNKFLRVLIGRGALIRGSVIKFNKEDNSAEELAAGHITFERVIMGPTPAERITFKSVLDISLLSAIE
ncbi:MAG: phage tail sheath subtilisin-like domain-containing protein [Sphingobacteriaceae bacterium]|nr:phage tail sheath subtilisin-like domain-containing protein [Sphingobacteriaceae bacterium]